MAATGHKSKGLLPDYERYLGYAGQWSGYLFFMICVLHFLSFRPLWLDEGFVLSNIQQLGYREIFGPLQHAQGFPRVFLAVIKGVSGLFNYHPWSLRIWSLLAMLTAFGVWRRVFLFAAAEKRVADLASVSFAGCYALSYYAAELKPYAMDVLAVGCGVWFLQRAAGWPQAGEGRKVWWAALVLPLLMLFSYGAVFMALPVLACFVMLVRQRKIRVGALVGYVLASGLVLAAVYLFDLRHCAREKALISYWDSYLINTSSVGDFFESLWEGLRRMATWGFGKGKLFMRWGSFVIPFFLYGLGRYGFGSFRKRSFSLGRPETVLVVLIGELFVLSALKIFPFTGSRVTLFMLPATVFVVCRALDDLRKVKAVYYFFVIHYAVYLWACLARSAWIYFQMYGGE